MYVSLLVFEILMNCILKWDTRYLLGVNNNYEIRIFILQFIKICFIEVLYEGGALSNVQIIIASSVLFNAKVTLPFLLNPL